MHSTRSKVVVVVVVVVIVVVVADVIVVVTVKSIKMRLRKSRTCVHTYITSKRIELESPGCTGFEEN